MVQTSLRSDFDGSYLCFDSKRQIVIRSGAAQSGMKKRWKEHVSASMCSTDNARSSRFYSSYPNVNCKEVDKPKQSLIKGNFQQIVQLVGVALHRSNEVKVIDLFEWSDYEIEKLGELSVTAGKEYIENRKYRHMCYMFELAYALCITPEKIFLATLDVSGSFVSMESSFVLAVIRAFIYIPCISIRIKIMKQ